MRHALVTTHLIHEARTAAATEADARHARARLAEHLAEDDAEAQERRTRRFGTRTRLARRTRRLATLARRARA